MLTWGRICVLDDSTPVAGELCSLALQAELARDLPVGTAVELWIHFVSDQDALQVDDPDAPAHFGCESSGPAVQPFIPGNRSVHGPGTFFPYRRYAGVRLPDGAGAADQLVFHLNRVRMQTYEERLYNIRFAVMEGDELRGYLGDAFYEVVGGDPAWLRVIAPTCVETGRPFDCRIVVCDRHGNKTGRDVGDLVFDLGVPGRPTGKHPAQDRRASDSARPHRSPSRPAGGAGSSMAQALLATGAGAEAALEASMLASGGRSRLAGLLYEHLVHYAEWRLHVARGVQFDAPGVYYVRATVSGQPTVAGTSNPIVVRKRWDRHLIWGDLHQHTYLADGRGTPAANYEYAISTSCLDFCAVTPHQEFTFAPGLLRLERPPVQKGWEELVEATECYRRRGIITILGSEAGSLGRVAGHMNCYYLDSANRPEIERMQAAEGDLFPGDRRIPSYRAYLAELEQSSGEFLLLPHAHARGGPGQFDLPIKPDYQTNVEICSVHGVFEEFYHQWLAHGHRVGVHGGGDNHMTSTGNAHPGGHYPNTNGLAGAFVDTPDRPGVWGAFRNRRTLAVTGNQRIFVDFEINRHAMGDAMAGNNEPRQVRVRAAGTAPILKIELVRNGNVIRTHRPVATRRDTLRLVWTDSVCSRRVDDSVTTGEIAVPGYGLALCHALHAYNRTDTSNESQGRIAFRTNAYSGITRGMVVRLDHQGAEQLTFAITDRHGDRTLLKEVLRLDLTHPHVSAVRPLDTAEDARRPVFTPRPHQPEFRLDVDWIDLDWPQVVDLSWADEDSSPACYYVRLEQTDGNIAWTSPIWVHPT